MADVDIENRLKSLHASLEEFGVSYQRLADAAGRSKTTLAKMFGSSDARYKTLGNVEASEAGLEKILAEYRDKLCG